MVSELAVEAVGLEKSFGQVPVLAGVDLGVPRGIVTSRPFQYRKDFAVE